MSRWLVGRLDPRRGEGGERLRSALAPRAADSLRCGPLQVAYTGSAPASGEVLCLLDGQLDNAAELRAALGEEPSAGESSESLLARAYRRFGDELPRRLRGDFVLLLWDREREEGLLARDQLGVRPCFLRRRDGALTFANEVRPLLALLPSRPAPDAASLAHWIAASSPPGARTLYQGIDRLGPATMLRLSGAGACAELYWRPVYRGALELPPADLAALVRERLRAAVRRRGAAAGRTAVLMSGGLDSSSVAAVAAADDELEAIACSATFPGHPATDEAALIEELRERLALRGPSATVRPGGLLAQMLEHLRQWGMPPLGWGDFWTTELMRAGAEDGAGTFLGGDGGDELFGPRSFLLADHLRAARPRRALAVAHALPGAGPWVGRRETARVLLTHAAGAVPERLHRFAAPLLTYREAPPWMLPATARALAASDDRSAWKRLDGPRWWARTAHAIATGIEQAGVYEHLRRRAAALGVESRHPLLDLDLVEVGLRQPPLATLDPRFNRPLLREAMRGLLPDSVRLRPDKAWFESLVVDCLTGPDLPLVRELLTGPGAELGAYVDLRSLRETLFDDPAAPRRDPFRWMQQVWRLLSAECWLRSQVMLVEEIAPAGAPLTKLAVEIERTG